jgi:hypothetical protein
MTIRRCLAVLGGAGGVGASVLAAVLAVVAAERTHTTLIDLDVCSSPLAVLLGIESVEGVRWSGLHTAGGQVDPDELAAAVPRWGQAAVLSCDQGELRGPAVTAVVQAARAAGDVVLDVGRSPGPWRDAALAASDAVALLVRPTVPGISSATATMPVFPSELERRLVIVPPGSLSPRRTARALGFDRWEVFGPDAAVAAADARGLAGTALRRSTRRMAERLWAELGAQR